jgi:hypothetical protein
LRENDHVATHAHSVAVELAAQSRWAAHLDALGDGETLEAGASVERCG